jgi:geranylgeranyl diphosphate synthase type II
MQDDEALVEAVLQRHRSQVLESLIGGISDAGPAGLYDLVKVYPSRPSKGFRPALCLAVCAALGGNPSRARASAIALELLHNGFLIHDDIQDQSEQRRGAATLWAEHGLAVALNVGNATNLLALQRLMTNRWGLGPRLAWRIFEETQLMMQKSLEGQAIEVGWITQNAVDLTASDYFQMCLKKTSWYTCMYPCRLGVLIADGPSTNVSKFDRFGWYLGAAFQIRDDVLNLTAGSGEYGKETAGDLWEGKRTLMVIHLLANVPEEVRNKVQRFLGLSRAQRRAAEVRWMLRLLHDVGSIDYASQVAAQLAEEATREAVELFSSAPDSEERRFLLAVPRYVVDRER